MNRTGLVALALVLGGCEGIFDTYKGLTNNLVTQGMILGVEAPDDEDMDLEGTPLEEGTTVHVFLADTKSVDDLSNAPITGAQVRVRGAATVEAEEVGGGTYMVGPGALDYQAGSTWTVEVQVGDHLGEADGHLPAAPSLSVPSEHATGAPMSFDLAGQGYNAALVIVMDLQSGNITYSNEPSTVKELYEFTRGNASVELVEVPGSAFPTDSLYVVGVSGMLNSTMDDVVNMNTAMSKVTAGRMRLFPVSTLDLPQ